MSGKKISNDKISSSFTGGKLRRYAKVTTGVMGGLAAKLAGEKYLGIKVDREKPCKTITMRAALGGYQRTLNEGSAVNLSHLFQMLFHNVEYGTELARIYKQMLPPWIRRFL